MSHHHLPLVALGNLQVALKLNWKHRRKSFPIARKVSRQEHYLRRLKIKLQLFKRRIGGPFTANDGSSPLSFNVEKTPREKKSLRR